MEYIIVGLGNPGEEYEHTRHNIGRNVVLDLQKRWGTSDWRDDKKTRALISQGMLSDGKTKVTLVLPNNYMNRSGGAVLPLIKSAKQIERLIIIHDDIDLGAGTFRIVHNRGSGGHKGVDSIERTLHSKSYIRLRIGVSPRTPNGKIKKPKGEAVVHDFILRQYTKKEKEYYATLISHGVLVTESIVVEGITKAMCLYNGELQK